MADNAARIESVFSFRVDAGDSEQKIQGLGKSADQMGESFAKAGRKGTEFGKEVAQAHADGAKAAGEHARATDQATNSVERHANAAHQSTRAHGGFTNVLRNETNALDATTRSAERATVANGRLESSTRSVSRAMLEAARATMDMQRTGSRYMDYLQSGFTHTALGAFALLNYMRRIQKSMSDIDVQAASLGRILGAGSTAWATQQTTNSMMQNAIGLAYKYGASITDVAGTMVEFARQGRSQFEIQYLTSELGELRLMLASSTGEFLSMGQAMKSVTTLMTQMDLGVYEAIDAVKLMAEYDIRAATSFDEIAKAMNRFASAGQVAGMSTKEIIETATAFTEIGIGGARAGTALNTIISRTRNQKQAIEMLQEMGIKTMVLRDGVYQTTSAMEQLLEAYRKVMASGDSQLMRRYGSVFAGTRMQSVLFAGMARLNKQMTSPLEADAFATATDTFQKQLQDQLRKVDITAGINLKSKVNTIEMDTAQVRQTLEKGIDSLIANLQAEYADKKSVHIPDSVSLVRQWFDVPTNQARAIVAQYSDLFEQISSISDQYLSQTESAYARITRLAEATSNDVKQERERALATMSDTIAVAQSRMKTTIETAFLSSDFIRLMQQGIESATGMLDRLIRGSLTAITIPLKLIGLGDAERGIKMLSGLIEIYLGSKTVSVLSRMVQSSIESFGSLVGAWVGVWERVKSIGSDAGPVFLFNDPGSRAAVFSSMQHDAEALSTGFGSLNDKVRTTEDALRAVGKAGSLAFDEVYRQLSRVTSNLDQAPKAIKDLTKYLEEMKAVTTAVDERSAAMGYDAGSNAWAILPQLPTGYTQENVNALQSLRSQNLMRQVDDVLDLMSRADRFNGKDNASHLQSQVERANNYLLRTQDLSSRVAKALNSWTIPDETKNNLRELVPHLENIQKGFEDAKTKAEALATTKATGLNVEGLEEASNQLTSFLDNAGNSLTTLENQVGGTIGSLSGKVAAVVSTFSAWAGVIGLVVSGLSMLWQGYKAVVGWTTNLTMETDKLADAYRRARQSWAEWQQTIKGLRESKQNTENVLGQVIDNVYKYGDMPGVVEGIAPIIMEMTIEPKLKKEAQVFRALDKLQTDYANYLTQYLDNAKTGGKDWVEANPLLNEAEFMATNMQIASDQRAEFIDQITEIYRLMGHDINQQAEIVRNITDNYLRDQREAASVLEDTKKQLDEINRLRMEGITGAKGKVSLSADISSILESNASAMYQAVGNLSSMVDASDLFDSSRRDYTSSPAKDYLIKELESATTIRQAVQDQLTAMKEGLTIQTASARQLGEAMEKAAIALQGNTTESVRLAQIQQGLADQYGSESQKARAKVRAETAQQAQEVSEKTSQQESELKSLSVLVPATQLQNKIENIERLNEQNKRKIEELQQAKIDLESEMADAKIAEDKDKIKEVGDKIVSNLQEQLDIVTQQIADINTQIQEATAASIQTMLENAAGFTEEAKDSLLGQLDELYKEAEGNEEARAAILKHRQDIEAQFAKIADIAKQYAQAIANAKDDEARKAAEAEALSAMGQVVTSMFQARDSIMATAKEFGLRVLGEAKGLFDKITSGISKLFGGVGVSVKEGAKTADGKSTGSATAVDPKKLKSVGVTTKAIEQSTKATLEAMDKKLKEYENMKKALEEELTRQRTRNNNAVKQRGGGGGGRKRGGGGGGKEERDLLQQLASEHSERMSALEIAFRTIKDSEGNIIEYLDRTGTVDYMRAQIEEIKNYEQELAKVLSKLKDPKDIAKVKKDIEKAALQRVKLEWEIQLKLNAAKKQEIEHEIDLLKKRANMDVDFFGSERRNELLDQIYAKEKEIHDMKMSEAKGDPMKERAEQIAWENKLLSRQEQIVKNITSDLKKQVELQNKSNPLEEYDRQFRQSNPQYFTAAHKHLEYGLNNIAGALESGTQKIQANFSDFAAKIAEQRQKIESSDQSAAWKEAALDQLKANSIDGFKSALASADKEIKDALDNFNMDRILPGQKIHDPILGKTFGTSFRDRKELLEKAKETIDQKIEEITQMFRDAGFSESEINSAELQEMIRSYGDKYAEYFKKELEALDKSRQMMMDEVKSALTSGWEEGFNIGIEHGFTEEGYKALLKNMKMTVAKSVSQGIQRLIADQMTQAITSFFNDTMDGVGSILGQSLGGILAPMISGLIGNVIGFLIGGLFSDWVNEMEEEQLKQQRDAINAQGFTWSYQDPSTATPYYEFQPPVSQESIKVIKFNTTFNLTTDAALAMASHRRELERVVTELFTAWTREASKVVGARV